MSRLWLLLAGLAGAALALATGSVALLQGVGEIPLPFNLFLVDRELPGVFRLHMLASGGALILIPLVIVVRRHRAWHRALGRLTAVLVVLGAVTAFPVALASTSPDVARAGFGAQGLVWLLLIVVGVKAARARAWKRHATLMAAMAAVSSGAIWVRLTTAIATSYDLPFDPIYSTAAWLGWLAPMALVLALRPLR